jgi:hypothetical protein
MSSRVAILLFSCSPEDLGWEEPVVTIPGLSSAVEQLNSAIVADIAERFVEQTPYRIVLYETRDSTIESTPPIPSKIERKSQSPGLLQKRIQEAIREAFEGEGVASAIVFLGRNPLYPLQLLFRGIELLGQEDDVVVLGEGLQDMHKPSLMWIALKNYHPEFFEENERWWQGGTPLLQAAADADALVMTVKPVRNITSVDDLGYLFHETEREVLLKQWYPIRTYEALWQMRRQRLIPETAE